MVSSFRPAHPLLRILALATAPVFWCGAAFLSVSLAGWGLWLEAVMGAAAVYLGLQWLMLSFTGRTLALWLWGLRLGQPVAEAYESYRPALPSGLLPTLLALLNPFSGGRVRVVQSTQHPAWILGLSSLMSIGGAAAVASSAMTSIRTAPELRILSVDQMRPFAPMIGSSWHTLPFFYTMGAWPKDILGRPILFTIPYAKGAPRKFVNEIYARWRVPDTKVTIEGPRSPRDRAASVHVRACFTEAWAKWDRECIRLRARTLAPHLEQMNKFGKNSLTTLMWFEVENPLLPLEERARGIHLRAQGAKRIQERYVIITADGSHQAFYLDRPDSNEGTISSEVFSQAIRSIRVSGELGMGRALANQQLSEVRLAEQSQVLDSLAFARKVAEVQALLISKISVEPKAIDAYYHLGGTALMLVRHAESMRTQQTSIINAQLAMLFDEWTAAEKPLVGVSYQYARDVDPSHEHTERLKQLWIEAEKYE